MYISPFLSVHRSCDEALQWARERLLDAGLRPIQTFDLHKAREGLHDCPCPNHGMDECDCQMVVLLVYGSTDRPVTLTLHGNDRQTWLSTSDPSSEGNDAMAVEVVRRALESSTTTPVHRSI